MAEFVLDVEGMLVLHRAELGLCAQGFGRERRRKQHLKEETGVAGGGDSCPRGGAGRTLDSEPTAVAQS